MERIRAVFNWSGGKDSAHALLTTVDRGTRRSSMHGIPLPLLQAQAESIGIPLYAADLQEA